MIITGFSNPNGSNILGMNCIKLLFVKTSGIFSQIFDISKIILPSNLSHCNLNMKCSFEISSCNSLVTTCLSSQKFEKNFRKLNQPQQIFALILNKTCNVVPHYLPQQFTSSSWSEFKRASANVGSSLTHWSRGFLMISGSMERKQWYEMG